MAPHLGFDFSRVRIHDDARAHAAARSLHARAFTIGQDVVLGKGEGKSTSSRGRRLLAHELAHVAQGGTAIRRQMSRSLNLPTINQFSLQVFYWNHVWSRSIDRAFFLAMPVMPPATLVLLLSLKHSLGVLAGTNMTYSRATVRLVALQHRLLVSALRPHVNNATIRRLNRNLARYLLRWRQSSKTACGRAAIQLIQSTGRGRPRRGYPGYSRSIRRLVTRTSFYTARRAWIRSQTALHHTNPRVRFYKGRVLSYQFLYTPARLLRLARAMFIALDRGRPVHVRVLTGYVHDSFRGRAKANHSLVVDRYTITSGTKASPSRIEFGFVDPDGGNRGTLIWDRTAAQTHSRSRFESRPTGTLAWRDENRFASSLPSEWDYSGTGRPWRYQVTSVHPAT